MEQYSKFVESLKKYIEENKVFELCQTNERLISVINRLKKLFNKKEKDFEVLIKE